MAFIFPIRQINFVALKFAKPPPSKKSLKMYKQGPKIAADRFCVFFKPKNFLSEKVIEQVREF